jgi:SAM-dependent methyltransferase
LLTDEGIKHEEIKLNNSKVTECLCGYSADAKFLIRDFLFYKCSKCSLLFVSPRYDTSHIYEADYFQGGAHGFGFSNYESDKVASTEYLLKYLKTLRKLPIDGTRTLIDIGAANGFFVSLANKAGFDAIGLEISEDAVAWAQKLNRPVFRGTIENLDVHEQFNFVTALDVLEHVQEPENFLRAINDALLRGGYLLINVPNTGSFFARISGRKWHAFLPPEHWFYFNKKSLSSLLEKSGFYVIHSRSISKTFTFNYIYLTVMNSPNLPRFLQLSMKKISWIVNTRIGTLRIFLPLFDNLTVLAAKRNS